MMRILCSYDLEDSQVRFSPYAWRVTLIGINDIGPANSCLELREDDDEGLYHWLCYL